MPNSFHAVRVSHLAIASILFVAAPMAQAVEIKAQVDYSLDGGASVNDTDGPAGSGSVDVLNSASSATSNVFYHTYGNVSGNFGSRVSGDGVYDITGVFTYKDTIVNTTGVAQNYSFGFTVIPGEITATLNTAAALGEFARAEYSIDILVNGASIWDSSAYVLATGGGSVTTSFADTGTYSLGGINSPGPATVTYSWNTFSDTLTLGTLASGASLDLEYLLTARAYGNVAPGGTCDGGGSPSDGVLAVAIIGQGGCGSTARSGDPLTVGAPGNSITITSDAAVPAPAGLALLGLGLLGLVGVRRGRVR